MPRNAIYSTEEEHIEGRRVTQQQYNSTPHACRLRSQQNQRAYELRKEKRTSTSGVFRPIPRIPQHLRQLSRVAPHFGTHLFSFYSRSTSNDNERFETWMTPPPYTFSPSQIQQGLFDTISALQGYQHRIHRDADTKRLHRFRAYSLATSSQDVYADLESTIQEFKEVQKLFNKNKDIWSDLNTLMAEVYLQSKARRVMALVEDYRALRKGKEWFFVVYGDRWGKRH